METWVAELAAVQIDGQEGGWIDVWINRRVDGWINKWTDVEVSQRIIG